MRSSHLFALLVGCFAILAGASPSISDYPPCAVACIIDALPQSPCSGLNQTCLCADPVFNEEVSGCVKQGCTVSEALNVANMTWADCGFPLTDNTAIPRYLTGFLFILPVTFISIRFLNKAISPTPWGADDACALAGFACAAAMIPIVYRLLALGLGRDIWTLQPYKITEFLKLVFTTQIFYITGLATIKASMLFFYLRVFPSVPFRRLLWATQGFNALIFFLYTVLTFSQCRPLQKYWLGWSGDQPGVCMDFNLLVLTHVGFNIALDIWMLILPLTQLYKLKLGLKKKIGVIMMFSVGLFLTAVSALRIQVVAHFATTNNITSEALWVYVWSLAELDVGVFVACMPSASQLWRRMFSKTTNRSSMIQHGERSRSSKKPPNSEDLLLRSTANSSVVDQSFK